MLGQNTKKKIQKVIFQVRAKMFTDKGISTLGVRKHLFKFEIKKKQDF